MLPAGSLELDQYGDEPDWQTPVGECYFCHQEVPVADLLHLTRLGVTCCEKNECIDQFAELLTNG